MLTDSGSHISHKNLIVSNNISDTGIKKGGTFTKILLIDGYAKHIDSNGNLNKALYSIFLNRVRKNNEVQVSSVEDYDRINEVNKMLWADLIFIQFPIYWFQVPGKLKQYLDDVFVYNQFYHFSKEYGQGGLMADRKFLLSTTWNAPESAFGDPSEFFEGKQIDDVLFPLYCAFKYCGFTPFDPDKRVLSFHDVVKHPDTKQYFTTMNTFITQHFE